MQIKNIDHFVITTQDLKKCLYFYCDILDMRHEENNGHHALYLGKQKINLHSRPAEFLPAAAVPVSGSQDFCLIVAGTVAAVKQEIIAKGWPIEEGVVVRHGALGEMQSIYLRDPDGNLVELAVYEKQ